MERRTRVFIGSSSESIHVADALHAGIDTSRYEVTLWQDAFVVGQYTLSELQRAARDHEFGVFIFADDDELLSRGQRAFSPRDNVVFEAGLFTRRSGPPRSFIVVPSSLDVKTPGDLAGVTVCNYHAPDASSSDQARWNSALRPVARKIEAGIERTLSEENSTSRSNATGQGMIDAVRRDRDRFRGAIERLTSGQHAVFEEAVQSTYYIGSTSSEDRIVVERHTTPAAGHRLFWRRVLLSSDSASAPDDDVLQLKVSCRGQLLEALRVKELGHSIECVVFFPEPVHEGQTAVWTIEHQWPGFWDPLRRGEADFAYTDLPFRGSVEIRFCHPRDRELDVLRTTVPGSIKRSVRKDQRILTWSPGLVDAGKARVDVRFR